VHAFPGLDYLSALCAVGYSRLMHPGGEVAAARAAVLQYRYILPHFWTPLEDVKAVPPACLLHSTVGGEGREGAIERHDAGFSALVVTVDTCSGMRGGLAQWREGVAQWHLLQSAVFPDCHASGLAPGFLLDGGVPKLPESLSYRAATMPLVDVSAALATSAVCGRLTLDPIVARPIVVKGVLTATTARRAVDESCGRCGSNHGESA